MRINKYLASCGLGSRRKCEEYIARGEVTVNSKKIVTFAVDVTENDVVLVKGKLARPTDKSVYLMLNKPKGCVCTMADDKGRRTVSELVKIGTRVFPVGRLDYDSEGLLLFTNDGDLANKLMHPKHEVTKNYTVKVKGHLTPAELASLKSGVSYKGVTYAGAVVTILDVDKYDTRLSVTVREGKNHEIKNMFEAIGHEVSFLKRVSIGNLRLSGVDRGKWRYLTRSEIDYLKSL